MMNHAVKFNAPRVFQQSKLLFFFLCFQFECLLFLDIMVAKIKLFGLKKLKILQKLKILPNRWGKLEKKVGGWESDIWIYLP